MTTPDESTNRAQSLDAWWGSLSGEEQFLLMDTVRLGQAPDDQPGLLERRHPAPDGMLEGGKPSADLADYVRRRPEYEMRFAQADKTLHDDSLTAPLDNVPDAHRHTQPLRDEDRQA